MPSCEASLDLISVHIPKTAGTSFRLTLESIYGETGVFRVDLLPCARTWTPGRHRPEVIPAHVRVVHGHFKRSLLQEWYGVSLEVPSIVWLRDPVDRVWSNYHYLTQRCREILEAAGVNMFNRVTKTFEEYVAYPDNQNIMTRFLHDAPLESFRFIGLVAHYEEDLRRLAREFQWSLPTSFQVNKSKASRIPPTPEQRAWIEQHNAEDIALYRQALALRLPAA